MEKPKQTESGVSQNSKIEIFNKNELNSESVSNLQEESKSMRSFTENLASNRYRKIHKRKKRIEDKVMTGCQEICTCKIL